MWIFFLFLCFSSNLSNSSNQFAYNQNKLQNPYASSVGQSELASYYHGEGFNSSRARIKEEDSFADNSYESAGEQSQQAQSNANTAVLSPSNSSATASTGLDLKLKSRSPTPEDLSVASQQQRTSSVIVSRNTVRPISPIGSSVTNYSSGVQSAQQSHHHHSPGHPHHQQHLNAHYQQNMNSSHHPMSAYLKSNPYAMNALPGIHSPGDLLHSGVGYPGKSITQSTPVDTTS